MPVFAYKALNAKGSVTSGELDAADRPEALRMLLFGLAMVVIMLYRPSGLLAPRRRL